MSASLDEVIKAAKLVSLPDLYIRLRGILGKPDFGIGEIAQLITHDPAMSARLLQIVNSAFFGFPAKIETVSRAVTMLGTQQVHDLVLATSVTHTFRGMSSNIVDMRSFWEKSVYTAIAARSLASACNVLDSERLFVAGLLRDIGHLIMYQSVPDECVQAISLARESGRPLFRVERELLGFDYAQVGGALMREWKLPRSLWEATELHVEPQRSEEHILEASLVNIAAHMADAAMSGIEIEAGALTSDPVTWSTTGLSPNQCPEIHREVVKQIAEVTHLILPQTVKKSA